MPQVTVLMSVYNGEQFLREAMDSILRQTFSDFEFLIINDGSTDNSTQILQSYHDPRIHLVNSQTNLGLIASLNKGLRLAQGRYIARMDCDDISLPQRLERQVEFMNAHEDIGMCGAWFKKFQGPKGLVVRPPTESDEIKCMLFMNSAFGHPTVMMRQNLIARFGLYYDADFSHAEDYNLWVRFADHTKLANLPDVLLHYREHTLQVSNVYQEHQLRSAHGVRLMQVKKLMPNLSSDDMLLHEDVVSGKLLYTSENFVRAEKWLTTLTAHNRQQNLYSPQHFDKIISTCWFNLCTRAIPSIWEALGVYSRAPLGRFSCINKKASLQLLIKPLLRKLEANQ